jgi:uncharacterized protein (TIGR03435 family)
MPIRAAVFWTLVTWIAPGSIHGQSPKPPASVPPTFDVSVFKASVPNASPECYMRGLPGGETFVGRCFPLRNLIRYAYKIVDAQLTGVPSWLDSEIYDFEAKANRPITRSEAAALFQSLLAERFKLKFHIETRTLPALVLSLDKSGNKMTPNTSDYEWEIPVVNTPGPIPTFKGTRCPIYYLSWWIGQREDRPVIDKTGLEGYWDFMLSFVPDGASSRGPNGEAVPLEGPNLTAALREQLGLKLASEKGPVPVYVIDHIEKAGDN